MKKSIDEFWLTLIVILFFGLSAISYIFFMGILGKL